MTAQRTVRRELVLIVANYLGVSSAPPEATKTIVPTCAGRSTWAYIGLEVTGGAGRVLVARQTFRVIEGELRKELAALGHIPIVGGPFDCHRRTLSMGDLRPGRDDDGQECKEQCADSDQGDYRQIGSHLHWFSLYPIGELSCHKA